LMQYVCKARLQPFPSQKITWSSTHHRSTAGDKAGEEHSHAQQEDATIFVFATRATDVALQLRH
jgi:hypothetical protein